MATDCAVTVEDLYKYCAQLDEAKDKAGDHITEYKRILSAASGGSHEKRLAAQFIARFFKYFPGLSEEGIDVIMELCADHDINVRKTVISEMPSLCRDCPIQSQQIADLLTQIMQTDDTNELNLVNMSLVRILKTSPKGTLQGIFSNILKDNDLIRERAIQFIVNKLRVITSEEVLTKDVEEEFIAQCRKVLLDVTASEFTTFMTILTGLPSMNTLQGRQQLIDIIVDQADLKCQFDAKDPEVSDRLLQCIKQAMPLFSKNVHSGRFVEYICVQVLPVMSEMASSNVAVDNQLELLKILSELVAFSGELDHTELCTANVYNKLLEYMPLPPSDSPANVDTASEDMPKLQFSYVECLMYTFHQIARRCPQFLTAEENADRLKDFRLRLQYFSRGCQGYVKQLRLALQDKSKDALKSDENKIKSLALKTTMNINSLIKDLFYNPPAYKATITLSWKTVVPPEQKVTPETVAGQKRAAMVPVKFGDTENTAVKRVAKGDQKIYAPPSGKFSEKAGNFQGSGQGRGYGWRGGYGRGRGYRKY